MLLCVPWLSFGLAKTSSLTSRKDDKEDDGIKKGYFMVKINYPADRYFYVHAYVPETYTPQKKYPLLIAFHRSGGTGQEFLPQLQVQTQNSGFIIVCPDSSKNDLWTALYDANVSILKRVLDHFHKKYSIDLRKQYLLGQGEGGKFILSLLVHEYSKNTLNDISGVILSGTEAMNEFQHRTWILPKPLSNRSSPVETVPVLYLQSRTDNSTPLVRAKWTKTYLSEMGYPVHYIEGDSWGGGFPDGLNPRIIAWCLGEKKSLEEIAPETAPTPLYPTNEFRILNIQLMKGASTDHARKAETAKVAQTEGNEKLKYEGNRNKGYNFVYVSIRSDKNFDSPDQKEHLGDIYKNLSIVLKVYDLNKSLTYTDEKLLRGMSPGDKDIRDYKKKYYKTIFSRGDKQIDRENSLKTGEIKTLNFPVPMNAPCDYVAALIYKSGKLVSVKMHPKDAKTKDFPDLSNIVLQDKENATFTEPNRTPKVTMKPLNLPKPEKQESSETEQNSREQQGSEQKSHGFPDPEVN